MDKEMPRTIIRQVHILGVPISVVNIGRAVDTVVSWANISTPRIVFFREVASLMLATQDAYLLALHRRANLVVPDGMPLAWIGRLLGCGCDIGRVAGADFVDAVCRRSAQSGLSHFFYGGKPGVAEEMARNLASRHPGMRVAGCLCPPIREIDAGFTVTDAVLDEIDQIRRARADFIWVGLSSPKQEFWIGKAAPLIGGGIFLGVGAAFDFHAGAVKRAPLWMRNNGLEWLYRLVKEPRRLWRRYLILVPKFLLLITIELFTKFIARITTSSPRST